MMRRQCGSLHEKPNLTMLLLCSIRSANASSTGLPKYSPTCFWLLNLKTSNALSSFSFIASAHAWTEAESQLLDSMLTFFRVLFLFKDCAKSWPDGFCMLLFTNCRLVMWVLVSRAFISFGATRGSRCGNGICRLLKLKS